ncbi:hypothetical protein GSI_04990 [Ganoderma sinense ZZ0214-1]|uniref:Uncharacterized protein n=1 Tax=Ganoderma sinense ZZ0214-1 TaxID=1077348 RepID=A0A2G8SGJ2_9APHY|nr:hypothetical protein GSI_04990 [Ganoderma sinense ZZ0214-1]
MRSKPPAFEFSLEADRRARQTYSVFDSLPPLARALTTTPSATPATTRRISEPQSPMRQPPRQATAAPAPALLHSGGSEPSRAFSPAPLAHFFRRFHEPGKGPPGMSSLRSREGRESANTRTREMGNAPHRAAAAPRTGPAPRMRLRVHMAYACYCVHTLPAQTDAFVASRPPARQAPIALRRAARALALVRERFLGVDPNRRARIHTYGCPDARSQPQTQAQAQMHARGQEGARGDGSNLKFKGVDANADADAPAPRLDSVLGSAVPVSTSRGCCCSSLAGSLADWRARTRDDVSADLPQRLPKLDALRVAVAQMGGSRARRGSFPELYLRVMARSGRAGGRGQGPISGWGLLRLRGRSRNPWGVASWFETSKTGGGAGYYAFDAPRSECNMATYVRAYGTPSPPGSAGGSVSWRPLLALSSSPGGEG